MDLTTSVFTEPNIWGLKLLNFSPEIFFEKYAILFKKELKIGKNLYFAIWKKVFLNMVRLPVLNRDKWIALFFSAGAKRKPRVYILVWGQSDVRSRRNCNCWLGLMCPWKIYKFSHVYEFINRYRLYWKQILLLFSVLLIKIGFIVMNLITKQFLCLYFIFLSIKSHMHGAFASFTSL